MAVVVNEPGNTTPPTTNTPSTGTPAQTPTSSNTGGIQYTAPIVVKNGDDVKVKGSDLTNDRISTKDLLRDSDKVIATGDGDDVFIFRQDDATNPALRNAVVNLGAGANDQIVLANQLSDYQVTFRENGSIKFEYIGDGTDDNAAITFYGAEVFTFRNIDDQTQEANKAVTYTLSQLKAAYGLEV